MKKLTAILAALMVLFSSLTFAATSDDIIVFVNNNRLILDVNPAIIEGRTVLPVGAIFESLGLKIGWDANTKTVTGTANGIVIKLQIDQVKATVNGKEIILDVPSTIINGRTLVPAKFVSEATGAKVEWDKVNRTVSIYKAVTGNNAVDVTTFRSIVVEGGDLSGHREANVVVNIGFGDRKYYGFTNEYGQLFRVTADKIILQDDFLEPVLDSGRYYLDAANVSGTERATFDKGHVIADSLGGVANAYNITPQDSILNGHGDQAYMEKVIRDAGGCTNFLAVITYSNTTTQIPSHYSFTYTIDGNVIVDEFDNVNPDESNAKLDENTEGSLHINSSSIAIISVDLRAEQVIIKNASIESVQMKGYKLVSVKGNQIYTFPDYILKSGEIVTVYSGSGSGDLKWTNSNMWNNDGDPAELYNSAGKMISSY